MLSLGNKKLRFCMPRTKFASGRGLPCEKGLLILDVNTFFFLFLFFLYRHSFSEDTWVKFSNLSEDRIIGTYDTTAHVSELGVLNITYTQASFIRQVRVHVHLF